MNHNNWHEFADMCKTAIEECAAKTVSGYRNCDLLKLFFAIYSAKCSAGLTFDNRKLVGIPSGDDLCERLHLAIESMEGPEYSFGDIEDLYKKLITVPTDTFETIYPDLVDHAMLYAKDTRYNSTVCPPRYFSRTIAGALLRTGCHSVSNLRAGFGTLCWAFPKGVECKLEELSPLLHLLGEVATDAFGNGSSCFGGWQDGEIPDAAISVLPVNYSFDQVEWWEKCHLANAEIQKQFLEDAISGKLAKKMVAAVLHFDVCNNFGAQSIRKSLFDAGCVETVVTFPRSSAYNILPDAANVVTSLVILDFTRRHEQVRFITADKIIANNPSYHFSVFSDDYDFVDKADETSSAMVPLCDIEATDYAFNAYLHVSNVALKDGQKFVRIGDVAELVVPKMYRNYKGLTVDYSDFSYEVSIACHQVQLKNGEVIAGHKVDGELVLFSMAKDWRISAGINRGKQPFFVEDTVYVLRPNKSVILPEYLVYILLTDDTLKWYMSHICEYYLDGFRLSHLMHRQIPIFENIEEQRKCVEIFMQDMPKELVYNAVLLGLSEVLADSETLDAAGIRVIASESTFTDLERRLDTIAERRDIGAGIDVVIANPYCRFGQEGEEEYDGLDALITINDRYGIPTYLYSAVDWETIARESGLRSRRLSYFKGKRFFLREDAEAMLMAIRDELKLSVSDDAKLRNRFASFFEAAGWYDQKYGKKVSQTVSSYLSRAERDTRPYNDIRSLTEGVIRVLQDIDVVPKELDPGAVPFLIRDRKFVNKKMGDRTYYLTVDLMPKYLSSALITVYEAGRSGSHDIVEDHNMGMAVINAFMSFMEWFYSNRDRFGTKVFGYYDIVDPNEVKYIFEGSYEGVVKSVIIEGKPYYYCGEFHLQVDSVNPQVSEGDTVVIARAKRERQQRIDDVNKFVEKKDYHKKF